MERERANEGMMANECDERNVLGSKIMRNIISKTLIKTVIS